MSPIVDESWEGELSQEFKDVVKICSNSIFEKTTDDFQNGFINLI